MSVFKHRLKFLREEAQGLTQRKFAKILNVSSSTVGMWETGERKPDIDTIGIISKYFKVTSDFLLGLSDKRNCDPIEETVEQAAANMLAEYGNQPSIQLKELIREVVQEELKNRIKK